MEKINNSREPEKHKLKYEKPAIVYHEKIEARAAVCTGAPPKASDTGGCQPPLTS